MKYYQKRLIHIIKDINNSRCALCNNKLHSKSERKLYLYDKNNEPIKDTEVVFQGLQCICKLYYFIDCNNSIDKNKSFIIKPLFLNNIQYTVMWGFKEITFDIFKSDRGDNERPILSQEINRNISLSVIIEKMPEYKKLSKKINLLK